jgi:hypothetical protein
MSVRRSDGKVTGTLVKFGANCRYTVTAGPKSKFSPVKHEYTHLGTCEETDSGNVNKNSSLYGYHRDSDIHV